MEQSFNRFLSLRDVIGDPGVTKEQAEKNRAAGRGRKKERMAVTGVLPMSKTSWYRGIREGRYPAPVKISLRRVAWRELDILALYCDNAVGFDEVSE